ncbi:zinc-binding alcohol dehydrogenase family protein [Kineococcus rubinsiae]|uniref:zinc-binding alcohol dehydrogenase family protein n=1 Tax=Kineococcus rubinsiae TaxID=2609562 RepID=UPI001431142A|nr:zinc-binding alcohol dehydrogenase family protein [Kineococcus rubinsiae]NIZ90950.1 zinc-binding alcohol dehydrogenase family protein [Kineococcus rubinsiae]
MSVENEALWLDSPRATFRVGPAPRPRPGPGEVVVRVAAVALNPVDAVSGFARRRFVYPWLSYPAVLGTDVAGEVVDVGDGVTSLAAGDRVVGFATGQERFRDSAAHGAFQRFTTLAAEVTTLLPADLGFTDAVVLPLGVSTAAAGLFQPDQLGLALPTAGAEKRGETVLVWGASTSVGSNAVQLARGAGYRVVATASPHNHDLVRSLGAAEVFDYRERTVVQDLLRSLQGRTLAGTLAIGAGSLSRTVAVARRADGTGRVASAYPTPATAARRLAARPLGVHVSAIWGGTPAQNSVGPAVFSRFLPAALTDGRYRPAPPAEVIGHGLAAVPAGLERLRAGVSARKLVVTV